MSERHDEVARQPLHEPHADGGRVALVARHVGPPRHEPPRAVGEHQLPRVVRGVHALDARDEACLALLRLDLGLAPPLAERHVGVKDGNLLLIS